MFFVDRFSALDDLPAKDRGNTLKVLATLAKVGKFSTFEVDQKLAGPITRIMRSGWVETSGEYPWTFVTLTDAGRAVLAEERASRTGSA